MDELREWVERRFAVPAARASKLTTLHDAIAKHIAPGDVVHLGCTHSRGTAAMWELLRQFYGTDPGFTLLCVAMTTPQSPLVHAGLANKIITSWAGDSYMTPGPNAAYQRAWKDGVEFEHWSILTYAQRLAAAARGVSHTTTRSLRGSMMEQNAGVRVLEDGNTVEIPALTPDVSLFHAPAADEQGNVLFSPPMMEDVWGALAARKGAIVTVERIVDQDFVRANAHMTKLPASAVAAVVEVPYGAHPGGLLPSGLDSIRAYCEDYDFWVSMRAAAKDPANYDAWIKEWILETQTHEGYTQKLGTARIEELERRTDADSWRQDLEVPEDLDAPPTAIESAIVAAARELRARITTNGYQTMLAGAGMANLAAWLAAYDLADEGTLVDLVAEMGLVGYWPKPGEPILFNQRNFPTCTMLTGIDHALGVLVGGARARSIGALGAAQVDVEGNINSTMIPGKQLLMGSGGANDVITAATETVVLVSHTPERLKERVDYVTGPGARVQAVVTTLGVMKKLDGKLRLTGVFDANVDEALREARARCGWDLDVVRAPVRIEGPSREELRTLRLMDPKGWFRS